jgi:hypothetical protein
MPRGIEWVNTDSKFQNVSILAYLVSAAYSSPLFVFHSQWLADRGAIDWNRLGTVGSLPPPKINYFRGFEALTMKAKMARNIIIYHQAADRNPFVHLPESYVITPLPLDQPIVTCTIPGLFLLCFVSETFAYLCF